VNRKTIEIRDKFEPEPEEPGVMWAFVDINGRDQGREGYEVVVKDEHGNALYAPPSRYSIWL
jgi:hypothetical protein